MKPDFKYMTVKDRRQLIYMGGYVGILAGLVIAFVVGFGLDMWRVNTYERMASEQVAALRNGELKECQDAVVRLAEEDYQTVITLMRSIDEAQGR